MGAPSGSGPRSGRPGRRGEQRADQLEALRGLLLGSERARLEELEKKPLLRDLEPGDVSPVLARAVELSADRDSGLAESLTPSIEEAIARSSGRDPDVLARAITPVVGPALRRSIKEALSRPGTWVPWIAVLVLLLVCTVVFVRVSHARVRQEARWRELTRTLDAEPGLVVFGMQAERDARVIRGLRDPDARSPEEVLGESGFGDLLADGGVSFAFEPYRSLEEPFVLRRARELLDPPGTVALTLEDGALRLNGRANAPWIRRARELAPTVSGVSGLHSEELVDLDLLECWRLQERLDGELVMFARESAEIDPGLSDWNDLADDFARLDAAAWRAGVAAIVELAPEIVPVERDRGLGLRRSRAVKARLEELPRRATLVRALADEKIVGYLNGGPKGKLPRVVLRVTLPGADRPAGEGAQPGEAAEHGPDPHDGE